jgi:hypothetical protein
MFPGRVVETGKGLLSASCLLTSHMCLVGIAVCVVVLHAAVSLNPLCLLLHGS